MASVQIRVRGLEEALRRLEASVGESALRSAAFAGAAVFKEEVIARAPVGTGLLKSQIITAHAADKSSGAQRQTYVVRVRRGKGDAYYWRFLEFGTAKASARPFIRPSWEARRAQALAVMRARLWERIQAGLGGRA
jgi:HK97 gp10 family phage protein